MAKKPIEEISKKEGSYDGTSNREKELLTDFLDFLLKEGYCDTDVYCEPPTAIDRYLIQLNKNWELLRNSGLDEPLKKITKQ